LNKPDNGILPHVHGQYVAEALKTLPPAESSAEETMETDFYVPDIGLVRFTAVRHRNKHNKTTTYFWSASKAVLIE
jgi:hypothetical protein